MIWVIIAMSLLSFLGLASIIASSHRDDWIQPPDDSEAWWDSQGEE